MPFQWCTGGNGACLKKQGHKGAHSNQKYREALQNRPIANRKVRKGAY